MNLKSASENSNKSFPSEREKKTQFKWKHGKSGRKQLVTTRQHNFGEESAQRSNECSNYGDIKKGDKRDATIPQHT